jgi:hypothetical protein
MRRAYTHQLGLGFMPGRIPSCSWSHFRFVPLSTCMSHKHSSRLLLLRILRPALYPLSYVRFPSFVDLAHPEERHDFTVSLSRNRVDFRFVLLRPCLKLCQLSWIGYIRWSTFVSLFPSIGRILYNFVARLLLFGLLSGHVEIYNKSDCMMHALFCDPHAIWLILSLIYWPVDNTLSKVGRSQT